MTEAFTWLMLTILIFLCWPWPNGGHKKLQLRRIEEKLNAIMKHLNIEFPSVDPQIVELAGAGKNIEAIKLYRDQTGVSLKEAKEFVESL